MKNVPKLLVFLTRILCLINHNNQWMANGVVGLHGAAATVVVENVSDIGIVTIQVHKMGE